MYTYWRDGPLAGLAIELSRATIASPSYHEEEPHDVCQGTRNVGLEPSGISPLLPQAFPLMPCDEAPCYSFPRPGDPRPSPLGVASGRHHPQAVGTGPIDVDSYTNHREGWLGRWPGWTSPLPSVSTCMKYR
jgi:hypothetical protein